MVEDPLRDEDIKVLGKSEDPLIVTPPEVSILSINVSSL